MISRRTVSILLLLVFAFVFLIVAVNWFKSHPSISVVTDSSPVTLQLNDKTYTLKSKKSSLRPPKAIYNYRASYSDGGHIINLYGTADTLDNSNVKIVLNYSVYTYSSIKNALCAGQNVSPSDCGDSYTPQKVSFVDDNSWAIVYVTPSEELGPSIDILQLVNGSWQRVAGPFSHASDFQGLIPDEVLGAINQ